MKRIIVAVAAGAALTLAALSGGSVPARAAVSGPSVKAAGATACADVLFVGARGSGEFGPGDYGWNSSRTKGDPYGMGAEVNSVRSRFLADLGGDFSVEAVSTKYPAYSAKTTLERAPNLYFTGIASGVTWTVNELKAQASACPDQTIVLAGYSAGAMVMHRVIHDLISDKTKAGASVLSRVAAAVLVADGDQVPNDNEILYGTAGNGADGLGHRYVKISHTSGAKFPASLSTTVIRVCNHHDPVCDSTPDDFNLLSFNIHTAYAGTEALYEGADQAAGNILTIA